MREITKKVQYWVPIPGSWLWKVQSLFRKKLEVAARINPIEFEIYLLIFSHSLQTYVVPKSTSIPLPPTRQNFTNFHKKALFNIMRVLHKKSQTFVWHFVFQLGFEPRTPSLKGMCSTCWATETSVFWDCKNTTLFYTFNTLCHFFSYFFLFNW